ncbi:CidA/LrgA family protein [Entomospira culicis]|uniref:CidA/LrgA family protein n=1 Tax=Entomospira culicis TaxID=2719989 RepID=A0A968KU96_9SPIO|nr:CidA/LrgA family protein [Entomospira culicis]NIZ18700.1 CidA/LrgA family protein [Entomospira culicis]NIZ68915.1 CidA/LrgA family protein [Entomospira culicis]WDI37508.1 CidA/LrgA family protein [Entomospira culicis]WDI39136.1 CidA/LrgA family protein [Entomospira culicis]
MIILEQLLILIGFGLLGHLVSLLVPLPGLILSMMFLFLALKFKWLKPERVGLLSNQLMAISGMLFIPMIVGILEYWEQVQSVIIPFLLVVTLGTLAPLMITGFVLEWMIKRQDAREVREIKLGK